MPALGAQKIKAIRRFMTATHQVSFLEVNLRQLFGNWCLPSDSICIQSEDDGQKSKTSVAEWKIWVCAEPVEITRELVLRLFLSPILITKPHCIIVLSLNTRSSQCRKKIVFRERAKTRERKACANAEFGVERFRRVSRRETAPTEHAVIAGASRLGLKIFSHINVRRKNILSRL